MFQWKVINVNLTNWNLKCSKCRQILETYVTNYKLNNKQVGGNLRARTRRHRVRQPFIERQRHIGQQGHHPGSRVGSPSQMPLWRVKGLPAARQLQQQRTDAVQGRTGAVDAFRDADVRRSAGKIRQIFSRHSQRIR